MRQAVAPLALSLRYVSSLYNPREGIKAEEITKTIEEDEDIGVLVLGASKDPSGPGPLVSTLAGGASATSQDGIGGAAAFGNPSGLALDVLAGVLYVSDWNNGKVRVVSVRCPAAPLSASSQPSVTPSGLVYRSLRKGTGASPQATDRVKVHYRGTLPDGKEFDSSYQRNEAIEFRLNGVIKCWTEGVQ